MRTAVLSMIAALALLGLPGSPSADAAADATRAPALAESLRYIGRDPRTGMPIPVDDRAIAAVERDYERYGKDAREAVPPPPRDGSRADLVRVVIPSLDGGTPRRTRGDGKPGADDLQWPDHGWRA